MTHQPHMQVLFQATLPPCRKILWEAEEPDEQGELEEIDARIAEQDAVKLFIH
jgi:hypothetical protein